MTSRTLLLMAALLLVSASAFAQKGTYKGEIMDSACAASGSHASMEQGHPDLTAKTCTLGCVSHGAKFVLYNPDTKTVYQLNDQTKPRKFAGDKVAVSGTLDPASKMIRVSSIKGES